MAGCSARLRSDFLTKRNIAIGNVAYDGRVRFEEHHMKVFNSLD